VNDKRNIQVLIIDENKDISYPSIKGVDYIFGGFSMYDRLPAIAMACVMPDKFAMPVAQSLEDERFISKIKCNHELMNSSIWDYDKINDVHEDLIKFKKSKSNGKCFMFEQKRQLARKKRKQRKKRRK